MGTSRRKGEGNGTSKGRSTSYDTGNRMHTSLKVRMKVTIGYASVWFISASLKSY
jgi:hypothetical protein